MYYERRGFPHCALQIVKGNDGLKLSINSCGRKLVSHVFLKNGGSYQNAKGGGGGGGGTHLIYCLLYGD